MKRFTDDNNMTILKRLTAILVAVVFVFGMIYMPAGVFAVETDTAGEDAVATDTVETDAEAVEPDAEVAEPDTGGEELNSEAVETDEVLPEEPVAEEDAITDEDTIDELTDALTVDLDSLDENEYDGFIYKLTDDITKQEIKEMEGSIDELAEEQGVAEVIEKELYTADSIETIAEVADPGMIEYIEPNFIFKALETSDTYYEEYGWYLDKINAPYVWEKGMFGAGVTVAVLDSGVNKNHEDLSADYVNYVADYNAIDGSDDITDVFGHGTKVTGVIAGAYDNGKGLTGVMPEANIITVKVLSDSGSATTDTIVAGIRFAINHGADVINMSFGGAINGNYAQTLKEECQRAANAGIILVAAAGNDGDYIEYYPASYSTVVSVASVGSSDVHSSFSNYNQHVAVSAPGEGLCLPSLKKYRDCYGNYVNYTANQSNPDPGSGTSFAAPQVASMAAMVKQMSKQTGWSVNYAGFLKIIAATSADKGAKGYDPYYGYGLMDLKRAYNYMAGDMSMYEASLSTVSYVYNGKIKTPSVTIKKANKVLPAGNYKTTYASGRTAVGSYKVTATGINGYTGTKTLSFKIVPPLVKGIKSPQRQKKKLTVRWKAMSKSQKTKYKSAITGYQVRVSTSSKFTNAKYAKVKGISKTKVTVKGLKKKTTYYVQYRSYKTVGSTTYYSKWSSKKKAKTK